MAAPVIPAVSPAAPSATGNESALYVFPTTEAKPGFKVDFLRARPLPYFMKLSIVGWAARPKISPLVGPPAQRDSVSLSYQSVVLVALVSDWKSLKVKHVSPSLQPRARSTLEPALGVASSPGMPSSPGEHPGWVTVPEPFGSTMPSPF